MKRREFLAVMAVAPKNVYKPTLLGQAYVWTQYLSREKRSLGDGLREIFAGFAQAGYHGLELTSNFFSPDLAARTGELLSHYEMKLPIVYNGGPMHDASAARKTIDTTLALADKTKPFGVSAIVVNADPKPKRERKTDAELEQQASTVRELSKELSRRGLRLLLHQHAPEMAENAREWRHLLKDTSAKELGVCLDVHWILRGGQDVATLLHEAGPRLGDVHLRNSSKAIWTEDFGDGDIDYRAVAKYLKDTSYHGFLTVELAWDPETKLTRSLVESLKRSRLYTEQIFGLRA